MSGVDLGACWVLGGDATSGVAAFGGEKILLVFGGDATILGGACWDFGGDVTSGVAAFGAEETLVVFGGDATISMVGCGDDAALSVVSLGEDDSVYEKVVWMGSCGSGSCGTRMEDNIRQLWFRESMRSADSVELPPA